MRMKRVSGTRTFRAVKMSIPKKPKALIVKLTPPEVVVVSNYVSLLEMISLLPDGHKDRPVLLMKANIILGRHVGFFSLFSRLAREQISREQADSDDEDEDEEAFDGNR